MTSGRPMTFRIQHPHSVLRIFPLEVTAVRTGKQWRQKIKVEGDNFGYLNFPDDFAAYDSFKTYGIAKLPATGGVGKHTLDEETPWTVLLKLANRTLTGTDARDEVQQH